jgi:tetratricopeptide (TPR) repeat protein
VIAASLLVVAVAACGGKSETQQANDALAAGVAAHQADNLAEATKQYQLCLTHDPRQKVCLYDLGLIAQTQGQADVAENYYRVSLTADPDYSPSLFNLALIRAAAGDTAGAIALYQHVIAVDVSNAKAHLNLGVLLKKTGDTAGGDSEIAAGLQLDPTLTVPDASAAPSGAPVVAPGASAAP